MLRYWNMNFDFYILTKTVCCDNLCKSDYEYIKTKTVQIENYCENARCYEIHLNGAISFTLFRIIHLSFVASNEYVWHNPLELSLPFSRISTIQLLSVIRIHCSLLCVRFYVPSFLFCLSRPFHLSSLHTEVTRLIEKEQKTCQIFDLNFYELINPWIYEFLNSSYALQLFHDTHTNKKHTVEYTLWK